jgi:hypothetical protein
LDCSRAIEDKRGWLIAGVVLALVLSILLGVELTSSVPAPAPMSHRSTAPSAPPPPGEIGAAGAPGGMVAVAQLARGATQRLQARGFQVIERGSRDDADCVANSYGQTQSFLRGHPCSGLHRELLEVRDNGSDPALVALAWVRMPDPGAAAALKSVLDKGGSGNVIALDRTNAFSGMYYASALDGPVAMNADADPLAAGVTGSVLKTMVIAAAG